VIVIAETDPGETLTPGDSKAAADFVTVYNFYGLVDRRPMRWAPDRARRGTLACSALKFEFATDSPLEGEDRDSNCRSPQKDRRAPDHFT
jgi:hypothetical protein